VHVESKTIEVFCELHDEAPMWIDEHGTLDQQRELRSLTAMH